MDRNQLVAAQSVMWCPLYPLQLLSESDRMVAIAIYPVVVLDLTTYVADKYDNADWSRLARTGGVTQAIIGTDSFGQGNGGVPLSCRGCFVQPSNGSVVWLSPPPDDPLFGDGPYLPTAAEGCQPIFISISDVAQLGFSGNVGDIIDIVYLLG